MGSKGCLRVENCHCKYWNFVAIYTLGIAPWVLYLNVFSKNIFMVVKSIVLPFTAPYGPLFDVVIRFVCLQDPHKAMPLELSVCVGDNSSWVG